MSRKYLVVTSLAIVLAGLMLLSPPFSRQAEATGWEWRQSDWSGGPGQQAWLDDTRYEMSNYIDSANIPGSLRLSYITHPYTKDGANPVIPQGAAGSWDGSMVNASVRRNSEGGYETLYRGMDSTGNFGVGYASSADGVAWDKYDGNPALAGGTGAWDDQGVGRGTLLKEAGTNYLWFRNYGTGGQYSYGYATSADMVNWNRAAAPVFDSGPAGSWEEHLDSVRVIHDGSLYRMLYTAGDTGYIYRIGYASSTDGVTWTRSSLNPVLDTGAAGAWDDGGIDYFDVLERPWMDDYMMIYTANDGTGGTGIGMATSPDGEHWTKHAGNPIVTQGGPGTFTENGVQAYGPIFDGSVYRMVVTGFNAANRMQSGEAYSIDGLLWNMNPGGTLLLNGAAGAWDDSLAMASQNFLEGGNLRTFYTGIGVSGTYAMGTAVATPNYAVNGSLLSSVFDAGSQAQWGNVSWRQTLPAGCSVDLRVRCGDTPVPDGTWTAWAPVAMGGAVTHAASRYIQYSVNLVGSGTDTPTFSDLAIDFTALPSTWYFAEGYTGGGFDQWITVQNPNGAAAGLTLVYYTPSGTPEVRHHSVPGQSRLTIYVNDDLGPGLENSCEISSTLPVIVERPMYFHYTGTGEYDWEGGHVTMGSTGLSRSWYFAEGYTGEGFEEWLTIQNPSPFEATVDVTYFVTGGQPVERRHVVDPASRYTINVNTDAGSGLEISARLEADRPILAERPMYFDYMGHIDGGHIVMGSDTLSDTWFLAEGATFDPFTEYITIQNPGIADATIAVTYYPNSGATVTRNHTVPANSRYTINAGTDSGLNAEISTLVLSSGPILVERPMYFDMLDGAEPGGHCALGVNSPSFDWYFGEGYTGTGYDEWLTLQNPYAADATVDVTYYVEGGAPIVRTHTVPGQSRYTINVGADAGNNLQLSAYVHSTAVPVIAERPMYFFYSGYHDYGWAGGHDTAGFAP